MTEPLPDSLFKLRLPGPMREKLEAEANAHGRTLTAEILHRLESTFSGVEKRLEDLEKIVFDEEKGNDALYDLIYRILDAVERRGGSIDRY